MGLCPRPVILIYGFSGRLVREVQAFERAAEPVVQQSELKQAGGGALRGAGVEGVWVRGGTAARRRRQPGT